MNQAPGNSTPLPEGFDERTRLAAAADGRIIAAHPDHPPVVIDPIQQTIDNYMEMEAKARAWDLLAQDQHNYSGPVAELLLTKLDIFLAQAKMELAKRD